MQRNNMQALSKRISEVIEKSGEINEVLEMLKACTELTFDANINKKNDMGEETLLLGSREGVFAKKDMVILKHIEDSEYDAYEEVLYENSIMKNAFKDEEFMKYLWKDLKEEQSLYVSIYLNDEFCGYCGIKSVNTRTPELAIELLKKSHGQGIGYRALSALMTVYSKIIEVDYFISRVDAENRASIGLMKKLGGKPFGLSNLLITCEEEKARLEKEYAHLINDNVRLLADEWGVEPEKLISHALAFRLDVELVGGREK